MENQKKTKTTAANYRNKAHNYDTLMSAWRFLLNNTIIRANNRK